MRNYYSFQRSAYQGSFLPDSPVVRKLIFINFLIFCMDLFLGRPIKILGDMPVEMGFLQSLGYFSVDTAFAKKQIWRILSFQFLHGGLGHLFFNLMTLYFFGPLIERFYGSRNFLIFYLLCGIGGPLFYTLFSFLGWVSPIAAMVGASAGIYGILLAVALLFPDLRVGLIFPPITLKMRTMALFLLGYSVLVILSRGYNYGGEIGHLGGAFVGYLLLRSPQSLNSIATHLEKVYLALLSWFRPFN